MRLRKIQSPIEKRFWGNVQKTDTCWNWTGLKNSSGYGKFFIGSYMFCHRVSYLLHNGYLPADLCVCHSCDNPACVNPTHLWLGTHKQNALDKAQKNRAYRAVGSQNVKAKLSEKDAIKIRNSAKPAAFLAKKYGIGKLAIQRLLRRVTWKHI